MNHIFIIITGTPTIPQLTLGDIEQSIGVFFLL